MANHLDLGCGTNPQDLYHREKLFGLDIRDDAQELRNRLVQEYTTDPARYAEDLALARKYSRALLETFNRLRQDALTRMWHKPENLPTVIPPPCLAA